MNFPRPRGSADLEEQTGHNAEDFLDEPRQHPSDWEDNDDDQEEEE